ncbi:MAG: FKBP-type peptidyl-prolyl cis-trans isomerase [Bacteroidales bacterium]|nr:FKBP-type peptidyl-prolyl cis-trans isomerase [Bacteroidales bacterium]
MRLKALLTALVVSAAAATGASAQNGVPEQSPAETDSLSRAVATVLGSYIKGSVENLEQLGARLDTDVFVETLGKVMREQPTGFDINSANIYIERYIDSRRPAPAPDTLSMASQTAFVDSVAKTPGAVVTPSGLVFIVITEGEGEHPVDADKVAVTYTGCFFDGIEFDSTDSPITFGVNQVTEGFSEGLKLMRPGGRYRLVMPASLGYGPEGIPGVIPGNAALDFTVDLLRIIP